MVIERQWRRHERRRLCLGETNRGKTADFCRDGSIEEKSMTAKTRIPNFRSEKEEARWWDAHPEVITGLFLQAKKEGKIKRLPVVRTATKPVTIRMPVADIESAQIGRASCRERV